MKFSARLLFVFLLPFSPIHAADPGLDLANAWFKPVLVENRSPHCPAVLQEANRIFYSPAARLDVLPLSLSDMETIEPSREATAVATHGRNIFIAARTNPGCGSACETRQMLASARPFEMPMHYEEPPGVSQPTPAAPELTLLKSQDGLYYVAVVENLQLQLFTLTSNADWERVCKVSLQPAISDPERVDEYQAALKAIGDLQTTIDPVRQDAGYDCGTLRAHERGGEFMRDAFQRALYRPWTLQAVEPDASGLERSLDTSLAEWSVIGIDESAAVERFRAQLPLTVAQLARFYARAYKWSPEVAKIAAEKSVAGAVARGFAFSGSNFSDGSAPLRKAILEQRPIEALEALNWRPSKPQDDWWIDQESPLNIAVKHPAALRWLLSKQLDPNHANAFGKTPLMYAAQHNALEAVRILLEHGANPNAATIFPDDTCTYTLRRANVTALHYAVRYGSLAVVQALIDGGALPFVKTVEKDEQQGRTPLEWTELYASPNIAEADQPRLAQLLQSRGSQQLVQYSDQQTLQAEQQYAAGDLDAAHRSLRNALQANASNERALSNLSLVTLKAGRYGESLEAATRLIEGSRDPRMLANAWFNVGLACERSDRRYLRYNDNFYCQSSVIFPFLQSWLAASSRARAEKLQELFMAPGTKRCVVRQSDTTEHRYIFVRAVDREPSGGPDIQRVYVLHPTGSTVSAEQIGWNVTPYVGEKRVSRPVTPRLVGSHRLGSSTLTVLESEDEVQPPVMIGGYKCF